MQLKSLIMPVVAVCALAVAMPLLAHHSVSAEFDVNQPIEFEGVVKQVDWLNPHIYTRIDVTSGDGTVQTYRVEGWRAEFAVPERLAERYAGYWGARDG